MTQYVQLIKRNMLIYLRDKGAVFFSFLSMLVIICLMVFFLGDVNISELTDNLALLANRDPDQDKKNALLFILFWTTGGIIPVNAVMVTLSSYSAMVKDRNSRRADSLYSLPISRGAIASAYITSACLLSVFMCTLTFLLAELCCFIKGAAILSVISHIKVFLMIFVNSFSYSAIMYVLALLVKSEGAWSGLGTVIGTLVGFFGGIYMPAGQLSQTLQNLIKCTPVVYSTVMFRQILCKDITDKIFNNVQSDIVEIYKETMGITIHVFDKNISPILCTFILMVLGVLFLLVGIAVTEKARKGKK